MLEEEEVLNGAKGGKRPKRRAGELYDAFAGESDEDEQLLSDDEGADEAYRDIEPEGEEQRGRSKSRDGDGEKN